MRLTWLGTLGGHESRAYGVALVAPVVVGWSYDASGKKRAFRWENGVIQDLGTLGGDESEAYAVSENGEVVVGWACEGQARNAPFAGLNRRGCKTSARLEATKAQPTASPQMAMLLSAGLKTTTSDVALSTGKVETCMTLARLAVITARLTACQQTVE